MDQGVGAGVLLSVSGLDVHYGKGPSAVHAVRGVSFDVGKGESVGIVGESGSGKSTTARAILGLIPDATGSVVYEGMDLFSLNMAERRRLRPKLQLIFQDPIASLNPRHTVRRIVGEGLRIWPERLKGADYWQAVDHYIRAAGLNPEEYGERFPSEMSGGQCQRVAIARALAIKPDVLICDESVSALDVSVQAQVLNLLRELREEFGLTLLFISHDLSVVKNICDRVIVMYKGEICEVVDSDELLEPGRHPYTELLLSSVPGGARTL